MYGALVGTIAGQSSTPTPTPTPTFATWNPADTGATTTLSNGNLTEISTSSSMTRSTIGKSAGKWYWEVTADGGLMVIGIATAAAGLNLSLGTDAFGWGIYSPTGDIFHNSALTPYGASYAATNVLGFALDMGAGTLEIFLNGGSFGIGVTGLVGPVFASSGNGPPTSQATANFGASAFMFAPPAGYNAGLYV